LVNGRVGEQADDIMGIQDVPEKSTGNYKTAVSVMSRQDDHHHHKC
jgi:hypothetical protein